MKILIVVALVGILAALGSAGLFMLRKSSQGDRRDAKMAKALAVRVGLSVALFLFVLFAYWMGWVQPGGIPVQR
jgi:flagellar basal body-associated protein FliL